MASEKNSGGAANSNDGSSAASKIDPNDPLGYDVYAKTLWDRVEHALNRDPNNGKLGDDPLVVGLFGEWGVGKSYLLDKIQAEATKQQKVLAARRRGDGGFELLIPVAFQPWKYEHEEHLHVPILLHILAALEAGIAEAQTIWEKIADKAQKPGDSVVHALPTLLGWVKKAAVGAAVALDPTSTAALTTAHALAGRTAADATKRNASKKPLVSSALKYTGDGRYYYEIHKILKAVCRPGTYRDLQGHKLLNENFRVNFVIFVDDLDRCLPEKAVAVLELIKTIFNVESFAFVLALDEEVIERGIGHRYREYQLADKKSQMPITGFEYLEKIVHLPFRLPALTEQQAMRFVAMVEESIESKASQRWFWKFRSENVVGLEGLHSMSVNELTSRSADSIRRRPWWLTSEGRVEERSPQLRLMLNAFDGYVPRKLRRIVELWHQICHVNWAREGVSLAPAGLTWRRIDSQGEAVYLDTRVVFSLVLLQLFQPELFRFMRRRIEAFPALLGAFLGANDGFKGSQQSDIESWSWASHRQASARASDKSKPHSEQEALARIAQYQDSGDDYATARAYIAQRVRMGLAERLVEHFAAQRHVFNPLKMFQELAAQIGTERFAGIVNAGFAPYFGVLAQAEAERTPSAQSDRQPVVIPDEIARNKVNRADKLTFTLAQRTFDVADVDELFAVLVSPDAAGRANLQGRFGLQDGREISMRSVNKLRDSFLSASTQNIGAADTDRVVRMINAVGALAPWLRWSISGKALLGAVVGERSAVSLSTEKVLEALFVRGKSPQMRALVGDTLNRFPGGDPRFDPDFHYLLIDRCNEHTPEQEPMPGFVLIPDGDFEMGHSAEARKVADGKIENDNRSRSVRISSPFYMARTLTTVDQFASFLNDDAYVDRVLGREKNALTARNKGSAGDWRIPENWIEQRTYGNRPVVGVNWFQARAYARWLDNRLKGEQDSVLAKLDGYAVRLPNEAQWERAARSTGFGAKDVHRYRWPYGATEATIKDFANIRGTGIERISSVGVLPPTAIGLSDIVGNAWQWMDNMYWYRADDTFPAITEDAERAAFKDPSIFLVPQRGGSWIDLPVLASCSSRVRYAPLVAYYGVGFRVALSLAQKA